MEPGAKSGGGKEGASVVGTSPQIFSFSNNRDSEEIFEINLEAN